MLSEINSSQPGALVLDRPPVEVVVSEDGVSPLSLVLPPYEVLAEIDALRDTHFSIRDLSSTAHSSWVADLAVERVRLLEKAERFAGSATFHNRVATLAAIAGELGEEEHHLRLARGIRPDGFSSNRLADNLLTRHRVDEAVAMFLQSDLSTSVYANLRLASHYAQRSSIQQAEERVSAALHIDPLDFGARLFDGALKIWGGRYNEAISSFRMARESRPTSAALHTNMAVAYVRLGRQDRALQCLKKAVALDPLSLNALTLLADVAHALRCNEDAVPSLRYYLRFEQKSSAAWGRLARALLSLKEFNESLAALKRQVSLDENATAWNNMGVVYHRKGDSHLALQAFKHAMTKSESRDTYDFCIAARNFGVIVSKENAPREVLRYFEDVITPSNVSIYAERAELSSVFINRLQSLIRASRAADAARMAEEILTWTGKSAELEYRVVTGLLSVYSLNDESLDRALRLADSYSERALEGRVVSKEVRRQLLNNLAFVFVEAGQLEKAERHLQAISACIHKDAYPTATLGLLHLRRGHFDRANELYGEALRLAPGDHDKARIRQKWNLEVGRALMNSDPRKAARLLLKAAEERDGESVLADRARVALKALPRK